MGTKKTSRKNLPLQGTFQLPNNQECFGELLIKGRNTLLSLTSLSDLQSVLEVKNLFGTALDGQRVTCIGCVPLSHGSAWKEAGATYQYANVFPHFVIVGDEHLDLGTTVVRSIHFAADDLSSLFYDFDAFGSVIDAKSIIDTVLEERRRVRPIETGEWPHVAYFTGKMTVIEVDTDIGKVAISHRPNYNTGGPDGIYVKNRMVVSIEPTSAMNFTDAVDRMMTVVRFLSVIAGRQQGVRDVQLRTTTSDEPARRSLSVYWSFAPKGYGSKSSDHKPHPGDVPLDPMHRPEEFSVILKNWIVREEGWRVPRVRYLSGLRKGNSYDVDRLVAAANMFDILPNDAVPLPAALPIDLVDSQRACLAILKKHAVSEDRNSAISALKRMGKPSLPKKVQYRTALVQKHFGPRFSELSFVAKTAVQCRNYFVHGGADDFDFNAVEPFISFLTNALEFVFAVSDLIDAGWDADQWSQEPHGDGHNFARFCSNYDIGLAELKRRLSGL